MKHGFIILQRNYLKRVGEIDIIAKKGGAIYFVEVKTLYTNCVSHETFLKNNFYLPEENISAQKIKKIYKTAEFFLAENKIFDREVEIVAISIIINKQANKILNIKCLRI